MCKLLQNIFTNKITALTTIFSICPGLVAQAQEINSVEDYQLYCSSAAYYYDVESPEKVSINKILNRKTI